MLTCLKKEHTVRLDQRLQTNGIIRFLTSHTVLAFFYGIFLFLYELRFLGQVVTAIHPLLILWAGALTVYDILLRRLWKKMPHRIFLLLFAVAAGITVLTTTETGLGSNIKSWVLVVLPLVAFYPVCLMESSEKRTKTLLKSMSGAAAVMLGASVVALVMYLLRFSAVMSSMGETWTIGIRHYIPDDTSTAVLLYGIYRDTNHAAAYALIFVIYSLMLLLACRKGLFRHHWQNKAGKIFAIANMVVQLCYFPLANSRGGWLCLSIAALIGVFVWCSIKLRITKTWLRRIAALGAAILTTALLCCFLLGLRTSFSEAAHLITSSPSVSTPSNPAEPSQPVEQQPPQEGDSFKKIDDGSGSGRIEIWTDALKLFTKRPVLGTGPGNNAYYADQHGLGYPLTFGAALHNSYLDLLVDYGLIGFIVMIGFWLVCLWSVIRTVRKQGKTLDVFFWLSTVMVLFIAGIAVFLSCIFINTTAMYFAMLIPTGYLLSHVEHKEVST